MAQTNSGDERRRAKRIDTDYSVVFSDYRAIGPLREGRVTDQSTGGFRIVTRNPEKVGASVQLEIQQPLEKGGGTLLFEGRVVHVSSAGNGEYAMGIRLLRRQIGGLVSPKESVTADKYESSPAPSAASIGAVNVRRVVPVSTTESAAAAPSPAASASPNVTFRKVRRRRRGGSWAALAAVLALVLILLLLIAQAMNDSREPQAAEPGGSATFVALVSQSDDAAEERESGMTASPVFPSEMEYLRADPATVNLDGDEVDPLAALGLAVDEVSLDELGGASSALDVDRFIDRLRYAADASERGERGLAMAVIRRSLRDAGDVPDVWRDRGRAMVAALERGETAGSDAFPSEPLPMTAASSAAVLDAPVAIEVDASEHVMRVLRHGDVVAKFPVGLGRNGATPRGSFRIGNKISNPDWYNRGRVVQAGSPGNPLGGQWFGLADASGPLSYGIHPTADTGSVGGDRSLGCVRMQPADAETLFRLVPVGTPVTIHD